MKTFAVIILEGPDGPQEKFYYRANNRDEVEAYVVSELGVQQYIIEETTR